MSCPVRPLQNFKEKTILQKYFPDYILGVSGRLRTWQVGHDIVENHERVVLPVNEHRIGPITYHSGQTRPDQMHGQLTKMYEFVIQNRVDQSTDNVASMEDIKYEPGLPYPALPPRFLVTKSQLTFLDSSTLEIRVPVQWQSKIVAKELNHFGVETIFSDGEHGDVV